MDWSHLMIDHFAPMRTSEVLAMVAAVAARPPFASAFVPRGDEVVS
jgi:hypothetical protein